MRYRLPILCSLFLVVVSFVGCGEDKTIVNEVTLSDPYVVVAGDFSLEVGDILVLTATTVNDTDASYTWSSGNDGVATVDGFGTVTGVFPGEAVITATGDDTGVEGALGVVVMAPGMEAPYYEDWAESGHGDWAAEAFTHWNDDGEISTSCAKCHSEGGFLDFLGADGSAAGTVDAAAEIGTVVSCATCHNDKAGELASVTFPSGEEVTGLGAEARCLACHQGRESTVSVNEAIDGAGMAEDPDTVSADLGFKNIHYFAAGATQYGTLAKGGYEYADQLYDRRFVHVEEMGTCIGCHDQHSLEVREESCADCHGGARDRNGFEEIRMVSSLASDYDGDGDLEEGVFHEIEGLKTLLYAAIQAYAGEVVGLAIVYEGHTYPYFFIDTDGDGVADPEEAGYGNRYNAWTARLVRATFNYQFSMKDPGGFAHNAKYLIQLLYDAIDDLNGQLASPIDITNADRTDKGHFDASAEAFRHWDEDGGVSSSCSKCHGGEEGFRVYLTFGVSVEVEPSNGMSCETCHNTFDTYETVAVDSVTFPGDITVEDEGNVSNICMTCHSGRESKATIDEKIAAGSLGFRNVHYLPAAATLLGTDAMVGYEYDGRTYAGRRVHAGGSDCLDCHDAAGTDHTFHVEEILATNCSSCHVGALVPEDLRFRTTDYDGDGDALEPLADEVSTMAEALMSEIQTAADAGGEPICYDSHAYPYFFIDTDGDGVCGGGEAIYPNRYGDWTAALMKSAHNFQITQKEPGAWAHNFDYIAELLIDAIEDLGGDVSAFVRP